jgi:hypothetical protein
MMNGVDLDRLMSLRDDIGPEDFADVVLLFFAEIGETLDRMRADTAPRRRMISISSAAARPISASSTWCAPANGPKPPAPHGETPDLRRRRAILRGRPDPRSDHVPDLSVA